MRKEAKQVTRGWSSGAVLAPLTLAGYLLVLDFIDLSPWNDLSVVTRREQVLGSLVNELPLLLIAGAFLQPGRALRMLGVGISVLFFLGHIAAWWVPYLWGASAEAVQEQVRRYGETVTFLPGIDGRPAPNAAHIVVGALALATVICTLMAVVTTGKQGAGRELRASTQSPAL